MKKTAYCFGDLKCNAYMKECGQGFEVGFYFGKNQIFMGNFIHKTEAVKWYSELTQEVKTFTSHYHVGEEVSYTWYAKFFSNHLYRAYYTFLDQEFAKYHKSFAKAFATEERKYKTFSKKWDDGAALTFKKVDCSFLIAG